MQQPEMIIQHGDTNTARTVDCSGEEIMQQPERIIHHAELILEHAEMFMQHAELNKVSTVELGGEAVATEIMQHAQKIMQHAMQHAEIIMQHAEMLMRLKENAAFKPGLEHKESLELRANYWQSGPWKYATSKDDYTARRDAWSHNSGPWRRRRRT